jgi:hypothetical protein
MERNYTVNLYYHRCLHHRDEKVAILTGKIRHLLGEDPTIGLKAPTDVREVQLKMKVAPTGAKAAVTTGKNQKGG